MQHHRHYFPLTVHHPSRSLVFPACHYPPRFAPSRSPLCLMLGAGPAVAQDITAVSLPDSVTTWSAVDWQLFQDKVRWAVAQGLETIPAGDAIAQMGESFVGTPYRAAHARGSRPRAPHRQPARARLRHVRGDRARADEVRAPGRRGRPRRFACRTRALRGLPPRHPLSRRRPSPATPAACTTSPTGWPPTARAGHMSP